MSYRLGSLTDPTQTLFQLGTSDIHWIRIMGTTISLVQMPKEGVLVTRQKLAASAPLKRATIAVVPRPELSLNIWYLNDRLLWALPDGPKDYPLDGIQVSVFGGELIVESVRVNVANE